MMELCQLNDQTLVIILHLRVHAHCFNLSDKNYILSVLFTCPILLSSKFEPRTV